MEPDSDLLGPIVEELAGLRSKLPQEMVDDVDALNLDSPESAARVLEDVKEILVSRLTSIGGAQ